MSRTCTKTLVWLLAAVRGVVPEPWAVAGAESIFRCMTDVAFLELSFFDDSCYFTRKLTRVMANDAKPIQKPGVLKMLAVAVDSLAFFCVGST